MFHLAENHVAICVDESDGISGGVVGGSQILHFQSVAGNAAFHILRIDVYQFIGGMPLLTIYLYTYRIITHRNKDDISS